MKCFSVNDDPDYFDNTLKIFRNKITVSFREFQNNFSLLDAYHGNHGLYRFTQNLKEADNNWINNNEIEKLFCLQGDEICYYGFFAIKGALNKSEKNKLEYILKKLLTNENKNKFYDKIEELYFNKIIMIGHCSC